MPILYLILGHLVADFILQPAALIKWKFKSWQGILVHALIHFFLYLLIFLPYLPDWRIFLTVFCLLAAHFAIDDVKINTEKKGRRFRVYFILDQLVHFALMIGGGYFLSGLKPNFASLSYFSVLYQNPFILGGLILMVVLTYPLDIWFFQKKREKAREAVFKPDHEAMLKRVFIFTLIYGVLMIFGVYKAAAMA